VVTQTAAQVYTADRWFIRSEANAVTTAQIIGASGTPLGSANYFDILCYNASTNVTLGQRIEAIVAASLSGQNLYFSCWIYNNTGGTIAPNFSLFNAASADTWSGTPTAVVNNQTMDLLSGSASNGQWGKWGYAITAPSIANGAEVNVNFGSMSSSQYVKVAQCQLELGTAATAFEILPPTVDLARCQRRYIFFGGYLGSVEAVGYVTTVGGATLLADTITFPTTMASTPTATIIGADWYAYNVSQPSLENVGNISLQIYAIATGTGLGYFLCKYATDGIVVSCDL
jgi:hypothetical protein